MEVVGIVGSRNYNKLSDVSSYIALLPSDTAIVTGDARGVDCCAIKAAQQDKKLYAIVPAEWSTMGRGAGLLRNELIVRLSDRVVAFWDGKSTGTADTIRRARKVGKPVEIFYLKDEWTTT